jgi:hypothetical protein
MWATVNPDQRPTDLGPQDANFDYRGTDDAREFIWTGYKWVETTLVRYGTHAQRLALNLANVTDSELFVEWDRKYVMYQNQGGVWHYIGGTMWGTYSPDQRPTDLGTNDVGFDFRGTDIVRQSLWSGTAWESPDPTTTKGDLLARSSTEIDRLPVGADTQILTADSSQPLGVKWAPAPTGGGGAVTSVFGRTGAVSSANGDYTAAQVTGAVAGAGTLTTVGSIPKVTASGVLGPSVMTEATGKVGIGTASTVEMLTVNGAVKIEGQTTLAAVNSFGLDYFSNKSRLLSYGPNTTTSGDFQFLTLHSDGTGPATAMYLTGTGHVGIATATPNAAQLNVVGVISAGTNISPGLTTGDICACRDASPTTGAYFFGNASHYILFDGTTFTFNPATSNLPSDQRLKQNVRDLTGGLAVINQIRPIEAEWNGLGDTTKGKRIVSILAQELQKVLPGAVHSYRTPSDEEWLGYNPEELQMQAILAIQQLSRRLEALEGGEGRT